MTEEEKEKLRKKALVELFAHGEDDGTGNLD